MVHLTHRREGSQLTDFSTAAASSRLNIEVRLFAAAAEMSGTRQVRLQVAVGSSLLQVRLRLVELYPALQVLAGVSRWAVDEEFVNEDTLLHRDATLAMIPPVSGG